MSLKFGLSLPWSPLEGLIMQSQTAEKSGFDSLWYPDHLITPGPDIVLESFSTLTLLALKTKRCMIGPMVVDPIRRHPSSLAHSTITLDNISNGRSFLGIGAGEPMNLSPFGLQLIKPLKMLRESIQMIKGLWTATKQNPFNYTGEIFTAKDASLGLQSIQKPRPPIYVGALGPKTRQLTGEVADGWVPYVHSISNYRKLASDVLAGVKKSHRKLNEIDLVANIPVLLLNKKEDKLTSIREVRRRLAIRLLLETNTLRDLGWNNDIPPEVTQAKMIVNGAISKKLEKEADKIPLEIAQQIAAIGTPEEVIEVIENYAKLGATHFLIRIMGKDVKNNIKRFGKEVIVGMKN